MSTKLRGATLGLRRPILASPLFRVLTWRSLSNATICYMKIFVDYGTVCSACFFIICVSTAGYVRCQQRTRATATRL